MNFASDSIVGAGASVLQALRAVGLQFLSGTATSLPEGEGLGPDETLIRLVTSFATIEEEICRLVDIARAAPSRQAAE
jgi:threonine aldolase